MKVIIGLGNPGKQYENTRHNVGFWVIDQLAASLGTEVRKSKFQALYGETTVKGERVVLVKPMTYMNASGQSIRQVLDWYKPASDEWVVCYDDMDLPVGTIRLRLKGSAGGHNGIKSTIACTGTQEFNRVRIGISRPHPGTTVVDHVLTPFRKEEAPLIKEAVLTATQALETYINTDFQTAMNRYN